MTRKKLLLVTTKYPEGTNNLWLTNELAKSLAENGHEIFVCAISWLKTDPPNSFQQENEINVLRVKLPGFLYIKSRLISALKLFIGPIYVWHVLEKSIGTFAPDIVICNTPAMTVQWIATKCKKKYNSKSILILWDFFPFYLRDLRLLSNGLRFRILKWIEEKEYKKYDKLFYMTEGGKKFLLNNYDAIDEAICVQVPLWTKINKHDDLNGVDKKLMRKQLGLPDCEVMAVYGGAMSVVQKMENLIFLADNLKNKNDIIFIILGSGTEVPRLKELVSELQLTNILFLGTVPRNEYRNYILAADVGLVYLSEDLSVPSFPSKTIDYFSASIPVFACTDKNSDYQSILEITAKAGVWVEAGNTTNAANSFLRLTSDRQAMIAMGKAGHSYYKKTFDVDLVSENFIIC